MKVTDIIRNVLELIDKAEEPESQAQSVVTVSQETPQDAEEVYGDTIRRFQQIAGILTTPETGEYENTPNEVVTGIESVTTDAGGGMQAPKHPADIRGEHPSLYPGSEYPQRRS